MSLSLTVFSKSCPHSLDRLHHPLTPFWTPWTSGFGWKHLPALFRTLTEDDETSSSRHYLMLTTALAPLFVGSWLPCSNSAYPVPAVSPRRCVPSCLVSRFRSLHVRRYLGSTLRMTTLDDASCPRRR
jgi:hypothetical protein